MQELENSPSVWAVADISPDGLDIALIKNNVIEFSRNLNWSKPAIKEANSGEKSNSVQLENLSTEITKNLINELQQALSSCRNIEHNELVGHIFLTGSGVLAPYIAKNLEKEAEVPTTDLQPPESLITRESSSSSLTLTSLGLGLKELKKQNIETNLLPQNLRPKRKKVNLKVTLALAATVALLVVGWFVNGIFYTNKALSTLNEQLSEIKDEFASLEKIDLEYEALKNYVNILSTISKQYPDKLPVLDELTQSLPRSTWLTHLKVKKGEVEIKGYSPAASNLIPILEKSKTFKETGFAGTIISESAGEKFTIHANLEVASGI